MAPETNNLTPKPSNLTEKASDISICYLLPDERLSPGMTCPRCKSAKIDYDGLLNLVCPNCGLTEAGACT